MTSHRPFFLVLDVGTTSIKTILFDSSCKLISRTAKDVSKQFPKREWVEQNPEELLRTSIQTMRLALEESGLDIRDCLGMGHTNQRETTILWDAETGTPIYPAIVWEDTRTNRWCTERKEALELMISTRTGLSLQSYFSVSKIRWILDHAPEAKRLLARGSLRFGTVDTWLLWHLTEDHAHITDETNAARTLLFDIHTCQWDATLLNAFAIPKEMLPEVRTRATGFGWLDANVLGCTVPILSVCGDQQSSFYAAAVQATSKNAPITKVTCGTGTFLSQSLPSFTIVPPFYTTIAPHPKGRVYVLEGKIARGGKQVAPLLRNDRKLDLFLKNLAHDLEALFQHLPHKPSEIFLDGGVSRDGVLQKWIEHISQVIVHPLPLFDGTALGTAYLCRDALAEITPSTKSRSSHR